MTEKPELTTPLVIPVSIPPLALFRIEGKKRIDVSTRYEHGWLNAVDWRWYVPDGSYIVEQGVGAKIDSQCVEVKNGKVKFVERAEPAKKAEKADKVVPKMVAEKGVTLKDVLAEQQKPKK